MTASTAAPLLRGAAFLLVVTCFGAQETAAQGQASKLLEQESEAPEQRVDGAQAIETAVASFADAAAEESTRAADPSDALSADAARQLSDESVTSFRKELERLVLELEGDGALTLEELTKAFADARDQALGLLQEKLDARAKGAEPPPVPEEAPDTISYVSNLFHYTLLVRNPLYRWLLLLGSILGGLVAAGLAVAFLRWVSRSLADRTEFPVRSVVGALRGPLYFGAATLGIALGLTFIWVPVGASGFLWTIVRLLFTAAGFWLLWNLCDLFARVLGWVASRTRGRADDHAVDLVRKSLRLFLLVVMALFITEVVLDMDVRSLLAGLGIVAIGVSLAAQDSLKNLIGSFTIYGDGPFKRGDLVTFKGLFGTIEEIGFRSTQLRTLDGHRVSIPNAEIAREVVVNVSDRPFIRRRFHLDVPYETPPAKVREALDIVKSVIDDRDDVASGYENRVSFEEFGEHSLRIVAEIHHGTDDYWDAKRRDSEINLKVLERFAEAGIEFAYPTEKHFVQDLEVQTERAEPPDGAEPGEPEPTQSSEPRESD